MSLGFLDHMRVVPDHRIRGMVIYPLDELLFATLVGVVCGADDWEGVEEVATGALDWLRGFLPFANGIPTAQTLRKGFRLLDSEALQRGFAASSALLPCGSREERRNCRRPRPDRRALLPGCQSRLARRTPSRLEGSALHRRRHSPTHRQEDPPRKPRNPLLHHLSRTRSQSHSRRSARPLGDREQSPLDDGRDLRRRPLQNQKRRLVAELRRHSTHRLQHPQRRQDTRLATPKTPQSLHRSRVPDKPLRRLTI